MATTLDVKDKVDGVEVDGQVTFTDPEDFNTRQQRKIALATRRIPKHAFDTNETEAVDGEDNGLDLIGLPTDLSDDDVDAIWAYNDTLILTMLEGWTLDRPLPADRDALEGLPGVLYKSLQDAIAEMQKANPNLADTVDHQFSVDAVADQGSPTGA